MLMSIGHIAYEFKYRIEKAQAEWDVVCLSYDSSLPDVQKLRALQQQQLLKRTLTNFESDVNVQYRHADQLAEDGSE